MERNLDNKLLPGEIDHLRATMYEGNIEIPNDKMDLYIQLRMRPGFTHPIHKYGTGPYSNTTYGFLGEGEFFKDIIKEDEETMKKLQKVHNSSYEEIAGVIGVIFEEGLTEIGEGKIVIPLKHKRSAVCPWLDYCAGNPYINSDNEKKVTEVLVVDGPLPPLYHGLNAQAITDIVNSGQGMIFSDLHPHLIEEHHFFEGKGTPYRVDPIKVSKFLHLYDAGKEFGF